MKSKLCRRFFKLTNRMWHDEQGAVALMFMVSAVALFGVTFGAIDLGRYFAIQGKLQGALDNAALAAGVATVRGYSPITPGARRAEEEEAQRVFSLSFPNDYLGSSFSASNISYEYGNSEITLSMTGTLPLISTGFLKIASLTVEAESTVALPGDKSTLEVVFSLDKGEIPAPGNSLKDSDYLGELNKTAKVLTQGLMPNTSASAIKIGLVPYSDTISVGPAGQMLLSDWSSVADSTSLIGADRTRFNSYVTNGQWSGCVAEPDPWNQPAHNSLPRLPTDRFQPVLFRVRTAVSAPIEKSGSYAANESVSLVRYTPASGSGYDRRLWGDLKITIETKGKKQEPGIDGSVYGFFDPENCLTNNRIRFFTDSKTQVLSNIDLIAPTSKSDELLGRSVPALGLLWSWRMMHSRWRSAGLWSNEVDYSDDQPNKVVVLFTNGLVDNWSSIVSVPGPQFKKTRSWWATSETKSGGGNKNNNECASSSAVLYNCFAFDLDYKGSIIYKKTPFIPDGFKQNQDPALFTTYPATSILMPKILNESGATVNVAGWNSMTEYLKLVCDKMKAESSGVRGIDIYIVKINDSKAGAGNRKLYGKKNYTESDIDAMENSLLYCATDNKIYASDNPADMEELISKIKSKAITAVSKELRLVN